jgi:hypothetical protein
MAQYYTDFRYAWPQNTAPGGWKQEWDSLATNVTAGNPVDGTNLSMEYGPTVVSYARCAISWDYASPSRATHARVRVLGSFGTAAANNRICGPVICGSGTQATRTGYYAWLRSGGATLVIGKAVNGTESTLASTSSSALFPTDDIVYDVFCELSVDDAGVVKAWMWLASDNKPETPTLEFDDSANPLPSGWAGVTNVSRNSVAATDFLSFSVGTNGDTAPTRPVDEYRFRYDPYLFSAAELTGIPTLSAPGVIDITATSARPQVTLTY